MAASLAEILICCLLAEWIVRKLHIPGLVGMLLTGVILGPHVLGYIDPALLTIGGDLRMIALIVILLRAGFELSRKTLHRIGTRILTLAFLPATLEAIAVTLTAPLFLDLTYGEAALLGTILAAVSPAVVVPLMIRFIKERRGAAKGIPTMVLAAASVDDVYVIVAHTVVLGLYLGRDVNIPMQVAGVPISLVLGIAVGLAVGAGLYRYFDRFNPRATKRVLILLALAILLVRLQSLLAGIVPFAGLVSTMAIGFVILERREAAAHEISAKLAKIWIFAEIILFSLVGAEVDIGVAWQAGLGGLAVLGIGLVARGVGVQIALLRSVLTGRERVFVMAAYSPKATVQAAIGSGPLLAMQAGGMDTRPGEVILAVAVLSIVVTAPAGAWLISTLGKRILAVEPIREDEAGTPHKCGHHACSSSSPPTEARSCAEPSSGSITGESIFE